VPNLKQAMSMAISSTSKDDGWSNPCDAAFDPRDDGHAKLGELVRAESYVEVKEVPGPTGLIQLWMRLMPKASKPHDLDPGRCPWLRSRRRQLTERSSRPVSAVLGARKRTILCVPSQKGRMRDLPQRHRAIVSRPGSISLPS